MISVVSPGAEFEGALLHPPKVVEIGFSAHGLNVGIRDDENFAIRVDEGVARATTRLVTNVAVNRVSPGSYSCSS